MLRRFGLVLLAVTTGITGMLLSAGAAGAAVACGMSISTSMTLTTDLACPANGIVITGSNLVLDLGGHTISGTKPDGSFFSGASISTGRTNVTVRNGTIRGFNFGVNIRPGTNGALVTGLKLDGNALGIIVSTNTQTGEVPEGSRIVGNTITNTSRFSDIQLGGNGHRVEANTIANGASTAIFMFGNDNMILGNTLTDSGAAGISISPSPNNPGPFFRNQFLNNRIAGSSRVFTSSSISIHDAADTVVQGNTVTGRRTTPGVFVENSARTVISSNRVDQNGQGVLVRGTSSGTKVSGNAALDNNSGVVVSDPATATLVDGNTAANNRFDGINVGAPATTVTGNTAVRNGGLGIRAVNGVTDGGGNRASANGNPAQCTPNIACS